MIHDDTVSLDVQSLSSLSQGSHAVHVSESLSTSLSLSLFLSLSLSFFLSM